MAHEMCLGYHNVAQKRVASLDQSINSGYTNYSTDLRRTGEGKNGAALVPVPDAAPGPCPWRWSGAYGDGSVTGRKQQPAHDGAQKQQQQRVCSVVGRSRRSLV